MNTRETRSRCGTCGRRGRPDDIRDASLFRQEFKRLLRNGGTVHWDAETDNVTLEVRT